MRGRLLECTENTRHDCHHAAPRSLTLQDAELALQGINIIAKRLDKILEVGRGLSEADV